MGARSRHRTRRALAALACGALLACSLDTRATGRDEDPSVRDDRDPEVSGLDDDRGPRDEPEDREPSGDDRGSAGAQDGGARDEQDEGPSGGATGDCARAGRFAIRLDFDVNWLGTSFIGIVPVVAEGTGRMTMFARAEFERDGLKMGAVRACGAEIPDFEAGQNPWAGEVYGAYIPNAAWDQPGMPTWSTSFDFACEKPGCAFTTSAIDALLGIRAVGGGPRGGWQQRGRAMMPAFTGVDDDADGQPGITLLTRAAPERDEKGRPYTQPPLGNWFSRADKLMLGIGVHVQLEGKFESCDLLTGALSAGTVDTVALGCSSKAGTADVPCDLGAVQFLDQNLPVWTVRSARFRAVRTSASSCEAVRTLLAR